MVNWVWSFDPLFPFPEQIYIFTTPTCATTIITLKPCALNAEFEHFILRFNKISLGTLQIPLKEGIGGEREGDFTDYFTVWLVFEFKVLLIEGDLIWVSEICGPTWHVDLVGVVMAAIQKGCDLQANLTPWSCCWLSCSQRGLLAVGTCVLHLFIW